MSLKHSRYKRPVEAYPLRGSCAPTSFHSLSLLELLKDVAEPKRLGPTAGPGRQKQRLVAGNRRLFVLNSVHKSLQALNFGSDRFVIN